MADNVKTYEVASNVRHNRKLHKIGAEIDLDEDSAQPLLKLGSLIYPKGSSSVSEGDKTEKTFDLGDALAKLISEGNDIASMNMSDTVKLLGANGKGLKRADIDAALDLIKVGEIKVDVLAHILKLEDQLIDESGKVDFEKLKLSFTPETLPTNAALGAGVRAYTQNKK